MKDHLETSIFGDHEETVEHVEETHAAPPMSRREMREQELAARKRSSRRGGKGGSSGAPKGRPSVFRRLVVIVLALAVIGGGVAVAYKALKPVVEGFLESNDYPGPGTGEIRVTVDQGAGGSAIAKTLAEQDVVKSSKAFIEAANNDPKSAGIQPGVYEMKKQMKASDALSILVDPKNRLVTRVTIPEGLWATEIYAKLSASSGIPVAQYTAAAKKVDELGLPPSAKGNLEGYLFPASYEFGPTATALDQLKQMVAESTKRLDALGITPDRMERVVTVASLVEGEAQLDSDRPKVARVVENRLAAKMSLGFDSTVNYIFKKRGVPTQEMLDSNNPYNTRRFTGLPPGPISNPGESALEAAASPVAGPWLYFVTVNLDTGETKFAATYEEHQRNVAQFQKWCTDNKGKC
ncbi:aminodeoxychorismate lyase [Terrabacter sp. Root85]|uniref:endolytic transglycosylase MltG n=1 Tax=unclassified Terrabacter TaxID=2630222 RepID=UPI0006F7287B|nr:MULTISPECIES: endolytic transglycosylase MltG [unclassified Terrabacter]KRC86765.1 aminodeoxychorismate lyase [Terrabacter sp. Root85]KRF44709.1 aminodeoxychorismate lyase [Terrabacter sp. Soil811]